MNLLFCCQVVLCIFSYIGSHFSVRYIWLHRLTLLQAMHAKKDFPAPRLFDLVKPFDPSHRAVFYYALRDTLVSETLETATSIAYGSSKGKGGGALYRVVTLDGKLIDRSGTMTGGGARVAKGGMRLVGKKGTGSGAASSEDTLSAADMKKIELSIKEGEEKLSTVREEKRKAEDRVRELEREIVSPILLVLTTSAQTHVLSETPRDGTTKERRGVYFCSRSEENLC